MIKIKREDQTPGREGLKTIENIFNSSENVFEDSMIFDKDRFENNGSKLLFKDSKKWNAFKHKYEDEFDNKIRLMDKIMSGKKGRIKVTWVSLF